MLLSVNHDTRSRHPHQPGTAFSHRHTANLEVAISRPEWKGCGLELNSWPPYAIHGKKHGTVTLGDLAESIEIEVGAEVITLAITGATSPLLRLVWGRGRGYRGRSHPVHPGQAFISHRMAREPIDHCRIAQLSAILRVGRHQMCPTSRRVSNLV